jgi:hypothetical protein
MMDKQSEDDPVYFPELLGNRLYMEGKTYQVIGAQLMGRGLVQVEIKLMLLRVQLDLLKREEDDGE